MQKRKHTFWILFPILCAMIHPCLASGISTLIVDGWAYPGRVIVIEGETYVSIREFATWMDNAVVTWVEQERTANVQTDTLTITARQNEDWITANGRCLWCPNGNRLLDGTMYVPLSAVSRAFGFQFVNDGELHRVRGAIEPGEDYYASDAVWWLSRIIEAEAGGEPMDGKIAVGEVILNRVASDEFPDTIYGVIWDDTYGVQFTPTSNGTIQNTPSTESVVAAKLVLDGASVGEGLLYFLNPTIATSKWIVENRTYAMTIGSHAFYT